MKVSTEEAKEWTGDAKVYNLHTIILNDLHREYTGEWEGYKGFPDLPRLRECEVAWSTSGVMDTIQTLRQVSPDTAEAMTERLIHDFLPEVFIEREGGEATYIECVWRLTGSFEFLEFKFTELCKRLRVNEVSGDDDAFDYWPNTMNMLWDFACDLDEIDEGDQYRWLVWEVAKDVFNSTVTAHQDEDRREYTRKLFIAEWGLDDGNGWREWMTKFKVS